MTKHPWYDSPPNIAFPLFYNHWGAVSNRVIDWEGRLQFKL